MRHAALLIGVALVAACSTPAPPPPPDPMDVAAKVTVDGMWGRLEKLQELSLAGKGGRAEGSSGYDASVDYVAQALRDSGFDVQTPEVDRLALAQAGKPTLTVGSREFPVDQASLLTGTPGGGLKAVTLRPAKPAGCAASDYTGVDVRGALAIVDDTACSVVDKQNVAVARGAVGLLMVSDPGAAGARAGLFPAGYYEKLTTPVAVIDDAADAALRRTTAPVELVLDAETVRVKFRNVLAQTKTGDTHNVIVAGAHLDAPAGSPGINDNATGVAAVLETAVALGGSPQVANAVRFAFWGAGSAGLEGASKYVAGLDRSGLDDIALYLDADMLGSPNAGYFTYDGDQSAATNPGSTAVQVPDGSAGVERTLAGYLNLSGVRPADMPLSRSSNYSPFLTAGIPIGGLTTGANQRKTETQARLWGGTAGQPFDPNYRGRGDTIDDIDRKALGITGAAMAFAVATYAQSTDGPNGVPARG
jgi:Zn-dependent M28 family amino/carboxypeptidase